MRLGGSPAAGWLVAASAALIVCVLAACGESAPYRKESYVFGTRVEVQVWGVDARLAETATADVLREFDRLHGLLHAWKPSKVAELNAAFARGEPLQVTDEIAAVLRDASVLAAKTDHLFNPAIGRLVALWGFHADEFDARIPDPKQISELARSRPRMSDLVIQGRLVSSRNRAVAIDLGGYAKGYALDRAAVILRQHGIRNALINIGGNVMALGGKGSQPWKVGIQHPRAPRPLATLALADGEAIGTSGDYQRYFEVAGERYCHLIDPRTAAPSQGTQAVTVLIPAGAHAGVMSDVASKPIFLAGRAEWRARADQVGVAAVLRVDADGRVSVTKLMHARLKYASDVVHPELVD